MTKKKEQNKKLLYYLASPYTAKLPNGEYDVPLMEERADKATKAAINLLKHGVYVFAPIPYNAPWERHANGLPTEWWFWKEYDEAFVERMDALIVLQLDGWQNSVGVKAEIEFATSIGRAVLFLTEEQIESGDLDFLVKSGPDLNENFEKDEDSA